MKSIVLIGPGRVGQAAARLLSKAGYGITAVIGRDLARARAAAQFIGCEGSEANDLAQARKGRIVLLALPDDHLAAVVEHLRKGSFLRGGAILVHFSGLHEASILLGDDHEKYDAIALHPLQTLPSAAIALQSLPGSPFTVEGTQGAVDVGEELVRAMGGVPYRITSGTKPLYHAAACIASNYLVTLVDIATQLMAASGFDGQKAHELLSPLLRESMKNVTSLGTEKALTGPIARGDVATVARHLAAMVSLPPHLTETYRQMGRETVRIALRKGTISEDIAKEIRNLLENRG